ncbi:MAG: DUF805 domain-containing protein [Caulobacteraceae bacterium]
MNVMNLLFSFNGRIRRLHYWLASIAMGLVGGVVFGVTIGPAYAAMMMAAANGDTPDMSGFGVGGLIYFVWFLFAFYVGLALAVKRIHDRDRGGLFLLLLFVPLLGLWPMIELAFLDGTHGPNKFGPSPKGIGGDSTAPTTIS